MDVLPNRGGLRQAAAFVDAEMLLVGAV